MIYCTVDTHILADILIQYSSAKPNLKLNESEHLTTNIVEKVNICIESTGYEGIVVASAFAFIEILNQFNRVSKGLFSIAKLLTFMKQPPEWFEIEPYNSTTVFYLMHIPKYNTQNESVALEDAIHVATAMQRGPNTILATHDGILSRLNFQSLNILHLA